MPGWPASRRRAASPAPTTRPTRQPWHTLNWPAPRWRVLDAAHQKRNLAEYEGVLDVEESGIAELCALVAELIADVAKLVEPPKR
jgi:hypothetical protein